MTQHRTLWEWQDAAGGFLRSQTWNNSSGLLLGLLEGCIAAVSNAALVFVTSAVPDVAVSTATPDVTWQLCIDTAVLLYQTSAGGTVQITIPAPHEGIFKPDGLTVDPSNAAIIALTACVIGSVTDSAGNAVTAFIQGVRSSRRTEQNMPPG